MKNFIDFKKLWPHLAVVVVFAILSVGYMSPILKNKTLNGGDPSQFRALQTEIRKFNAETHEYSGWTNGLFGGMPTFMIGGETYNDGIFNQINYYATRPLTQLGSYIFLYLLGAYVLLLALGCRMWPSLVGAVGYAFFSYNLQIIEAGHLAKIFSLAYAPMMVAGLVMDFRGRMWAGAALFSLGVGLNLNGNHPQITFYTAIVMLIFGIFELVRAIKNGKMGSFLAAVALAVVFGLVATATDTARLWTTWDHAKETIRGGSELTQKAGTTPAAKGGLDKEYAFGWSQGKLETLTFLIPNFSGGGSGGELNNKSASYKALTNLGVDGEQAAGFVQQLPTYWGDQTFVSGGVYAGAIICFLFVLGMFFADKRYRWPFAVAALVTLFLGWGSNFSVLNYFLFDHVPMFNKFRSVSMILSLTQMCMIVVATLGLKNILQTPPTWTDFKRPLFISLGITAGLALILALVPSIVGLKSANDAAFIDQISQSFGNNKTAANDLYNALVDDRAALLRSDALRSVLFILLVAGLLWAFVTQKLKNTTIVAGAVAFLALIDMWTVNKRYLNADDFSTKFANYDDAFEATPADLQILQDKDPNYRVFDVTSSPFTNSKTSAFHKSLGGYSATKLQRYQDLIENQMSKNNMSVLNMLNAKYFIVADKDNKPAAQLNPAALGNAWFVREIKTVNNADEEMKALDNFDPKRTAVVDKRFNDILKAAKPSADSAGKITLTSYKPNALSYEYDAKSPQIAVFSEIYYKGNEDWKSYVDGQEVPHFRADYVLRAMALPAGKHKVEFKFSPVTVVKGRQIDLWASIGWGLLVGVALFMDRKNKKENV